MNRVLDYIFRMPPSLMYAIVGALAVAVFWACYEQQKWLAECAEQTHGSVERERTGETFYTNDKGMPTGSSVNWHYYVRTKSGKRIEYGAKYEPE